MKFSHALIMVFVVLLSAEWLVGSESDDDAVIDGITESVARRQAEKEQFAQSPEPEPTPRAATFNAWALDDEDDWAEPENSAAIEIMDHGAPSRTGFTAHAIERTTIRGALASAPQLTVSGARIPAPRTALIES